MRRSFHKDALIAQLVATGHLDAGESAFFARELEHIEPKLYDVKYPELKGRSFLPKFSGLSPTDEYWTYRQFDRVGAAKEGDQSSDDIPTVAIGGTEATAKVVPILMGYDYTVQEIRQSAAVGRPLDTMKAMAAREFVERKIDMMIAQGSDNRASNSVYGMLNQPNFDVMATTAAGALALPAGAADGGAARIWGDGHLTPKEIVAQLNAAYRYVVTNTKEVHRPNSLVLDLASKLYIETTPCSNADANFAGSVMTIEQYIRANAPWLKRIDSWIRCNQTATGGLGLGTVGANSRSILWEDSADNGNYAVPQEFESMPPQLRNFKFWVPCHARCAGARFRYPKCGVYLDGLQ